MKRLLHARGTLAAMVSILVVLATAGGYALASGAGTIKACVHNRSHTLYVGKCHKGDSHLQWNQAGPRGVVGPRGTAGPTGDTGAAGP